MLVFIMLIIKQNLHLEIAIWKFFNIGYGEYRNLHLANTINAAENDSANSVNAAKNDWAYWQFSVSGALVNTSIKISDFMLKHHLLGGNGI